MADDAMTRWRIFESKSGSRVLCGDCQVDLSKFVRVLDFDVISLDF